MKKLLILLPITLLQGCLWQSVDSETLYYANKFCNEKSMKVYKISEWWHGSVNLSCSPTGLRKGEIKEQDFHKYIWEQRRILTQRPLLGEDY